MQRDYVRRSYSKPNRWMYIPEYRPRIEINWRAMVTDFLLAIPMGALLTVAILKAAQTL